MDCKSSRLALVFVACLCLGQCAQLAQAGQGCPFDNNSCQEYCSQQGCNFGYCGHFAWTQCICRKCGNEWGYYDKVHYAPNKQVNQTELESLNLNGTEPLVASDANGQQQEANQTAGQEEKRATLTTLLIPDLSESSKLDINDIPDENSEKFLDFLAKNHEKLVLATSQQHEESGRTAAAAAAAATTTTAAPAPGEEAEETVEIQISTSSNNTDLQRNESTSEEEEAANSSPVTRLLRMAVVERSPDELERRRR